MKILKKILTARGFFGEPIWIWVLMYGTAVFYGFSAIWFSQHNILQP